MSDNVELRGLAKLAREAARGDAMAVFALEQASGDGQQGAWVKLKYLEVKPFVDAACLGDHLAACALRLLREIGNMGARFALKNLALNGLFDRASQGAAPAVFALRSLVEAGTRKARFALKTLKWDSLSRKAADGDPWAFFALHTLVWAGNLEVGQKVRELGRHEERIRNRLGPEKMSLAKKAARGDPRAVFSLFPFHAP